MLGNNSIFKFLIYIIFLYIKINKLRVKSKVSLTLLIIILISFLIYDIILIYNNMC